MTTGSEFRFRFNLTAALLLRFVHSNYQHLLFNVVSLCAHGFSVFENFGGLGLYGVFFGGGIFAALHKPTRELQVQNHLQESIPSLPSGAGFIGDSWDKIRGRVSSLVGPRLLRYQQTVVRTWVAGL